LIGLFFIVKEKTSKIAINMFSRER
jgi:hypothetical protein